MPEPAAKDKPSDCYWQLPLLDVPETTQVPACGIGQAAATQTRVQPLLFHWAASVVSVVPSST
jgi:hypothetical protein